LPELDSWGCNVLFLSYFVELFLGNLNTENHKQNLIFQGDSMGLFNSFLILLAALSTYGVPVKANESAGIKFTQLADKYFDEYYKRHPSSATYIGFHQFDDKMDDYSKKAVDENNSFLKQQLKIFQAVNKKQLNLNDSIDLELVLNDIRSQLLTSQNLRVWEKQPDIYSSGLSSTAFYMISRSFAPPAERLKNLIAREKLMPQALIEAKKNLKNPPKIYTEVAIEKLPGTISFFKSDVPLAFQDVKDKELLKQFEGTNSKVIEALEKYLEFLKSDLLPRSKGDFRIGKENYKKKLLYEEAVETPLEKILEMGYKNLHENQERFKQTAFKLNPEKTAQEILHELEKEHPAPDKLLETIRGKMDGLKQYLIDKKIVTIPTTTSLFVQESPPFMRGVSTASMDTPGPYETKAKEAYYNVTLPEKTWAPEKVEDYMSNFSNGVIIATSVHEAYPGHYIQFLWVQQGLSKTRKLLGCGSNAEGWAHYTEQMMLDEGYGNGDLKLRLGQLQDALLRNARLIVGIKMHTGQMTYDQGVQFFMKEGYQGKTPSELETRRGTMDPTYLVYTLGKLQILKLRDDYKKMKGDKFSLTEFHDTFLKQGSPPVKFVRRMMMGKDGDML
jgi:uncharacterized protein (DUF885 family)